MPTVLITDYDFPELDIEKKVFADAGVNVSITQAESTEDVIRAADEAGADALLVQYAQITPVVFKELPNLKVVGKYGIGTDNIDSEAAADHDVPVLNVPAYCQDEVAEHALGLLLSCERKLPLLDGSVKSGTWDWTVAEPVHRLSGKTLGVVGCGRIGARFIQKTSGFEFDVLGYDPNLSEEEIADRGANSVSFEELLTRADLVSVHVPLTPDTNGLFNAEAFERMRSTAILVNTSRGPVVDTEALTDALDDRELRGAGLDVLPEEPPHESPLFERDDVVLTPHIAWYSVESIEVLRKTIATDITRVLKGETPENVVNSDTLDLAS